MPQTYFIVAYFKIAYFFVAYFEMTYLIVAYFCIWAKKYYMRKNRWQELNFRPTASRLQKKTTSATKTILATIGVEVLINVNFIIFVFSPRDPSNLSPKGELL